jgi:transcriptional regulator with XRE-family HTH domain
MPLGWEVDVPTKAMGAMLRALREAAGLSQDQLAQAAGVPVGTLRNWEYGRREPLLSAAGRLAAALGVSVDELLKAPTADEVSARSKRGRPRKAPAAGQERRRKGKA